MYVTHDRTGKYLLFLNYEGKLRILYTPFQVLCIATIGSIKANTTVYVEAVASTPQNELIYIIYGTAYFYHFFYLVAKF